MTSALTPAKTHGVSITKNSCSRVLKLSCEIKTHSLVLIMLLKKSIDCYINSTHQLSVFVLEACPSIRSPIR
jgi:hypothetical protein